MKKILCFISVLCSVATHAFAQNNNNEVIPLLNAYDFLFFNRISDQYSDSNKRSVLFEKAQATASTIQNNPALQKEFKPVYTRYYAEYSYLATLTQLDKKEPLTQLLSTLDTTIKWFSNNLDVDTDSAVINKLKTAVGIREESVTYDNRELYDTLISRYNFLINTYNSFLLDSLQLQLQEYTETNRFDTAIVDRVFTQYKLYNEPILAIYYTDTTFKAIFKIYTYFKTLQGAASHNCDSLLYYFSLFKALQTSAPEVMHNIPALKDTSMNCNPDSAYRTQIAIAAYRDYIPDEDTTMPSLPPPSSKFKRSKPFGKFFEKVTIPSPPPAPVEVSNVRGSGSYNMPAFPWPPPAPSSRSLPLKFKSSNIHTLEDANQQLLNALVKAKYDSPAYYNVPGGFALVTPLEQLETDGKPKGDPPRWNVKVQLSDEFSFMNYLKALFVGLKGYYRVIAFIVTDQPLSFNQSVKASTEIINIAGGLDRLPAEIGYKPFTSNHRCSVLIYEFEKENNGNVTNFIKQGRYSVQTHLNKTLVWQSLFE